MFHITPEIMENSYELLRVTVPFKGWKLPHADDLEFQVTDDDDSYGEFIYEDAGLTQWPRIAVSMVHNKDLSTLLGTMAHEMVHLREYQLEQKTGRKYRGDHGKRFQKLADQVCRHHIQFNREKF